MTRTIVFRSLLAAALVAVAVLGYIRYQQRESEKRLQEAIAAEQARMAFENATTVVTVSNPSGGNATLQTATPNGKNADGSTQWLYNDACTALPHQVCSADIYLHRDVRVRVVTQYIFLGNAMSPWQVVSSLNAPVRLSAWHSTSDNNCCYVSNP